MILRFLTAFLMAIALLSSVALQTIQAAERRPNFLLIVADDIRGSRDNEGLYK